ncbi:MAG: hypothetical protein WCW56_00445 [Candidatus Paceibacterota bacterium]|jgi:hypothetical protein
MNKYLSKRNQIIIGAVIIFLVAGYGGYKIGQSKRVTGGQFGSNSRMGQGMTGRKPAGFATGDILSRDTNGVTIKLRNGGSQIILVSPSTEVSKMSPTDQSELAIGKSIIANGKTNADGSVTATTIQIRPNTPVPMGGQGGPIGN